MSAAEGVHPEKNCSYQEVLDHLKMTKSNELYYMTRPVKNYKRPTQVSLEVLLYAILDMVSPPSLHLMKLLPLKSHVSSWRQVEKEQKFIPYVWTVIVSSLLLL